MDNGGQDERSVAKGCKGGKCYSIWEETCDVSRYLDGEACLADATGPVGVDRNPYFPYYWMKLETERIVEQSSVPWTILRATQFHEFVLKQIRFLELGPVALLPKGFVLQPIDAGEVADRLVELALSAPAGHAPDVGGPEVRTFADLAHSYQGATGRHRRLVEVPVPGKVARAFREGAQTCPERRYGTIIWEEFLHRTILSTETDPKRWKELS